MAGVPDEWKKLQRYDDERKVKETLAGLTETQKEIAKEALAGLKGVDLARMKAKGKGHTYTGPAEDNAAEKAEAVERAKERYSDSLRQLAEAEAQSSEAATNVYGYTETLTQNELVKYKKALEQYRAALARMEAEGAGKSSEAAAIREEAARLEKAITILTPMAAPFRYRIIL